MSLRTWNAGHCKRPKRGDRIETHVGVGKVVQVKDGGRELLVQTDVHGKMPVYRASHGWWTRAS